MTTPTTVRRSALIPVSTETAFTAALTLPLPLLYRRRYGPMPPIVEVRDQAGDWTTPGETRVFVTADGGSMREEMLSIERPRRFTNRLTVLGGPFTHLVAEVVETWSFRDVGTGTEATWEWNLFAKSAGAGLVVPVIGRLWLGYARNVLAQLTEEVVGSPAN